MSSPYNYQLPPPPKKKSWNQVTFWVLLEFPESLRKMASSFNLSAVQKTLSFLRWEITHLQGCGFAEALSLQDTGQDVPYPGKR